MDGKSSPPNFPPLPVDRGWAWLVMLGAFVNSLFGFAFIRSLSIFFMEFLDRFQESATMTTLAFSLNTAAASVFSILMPSLFLSRFSVRSLCLFGAVINAVAIIALAFAPNVYVVTALLVFVGVGHPFIFISQVTLLGVYFKKRLSLAVACANIGVSLATIGSPALTQIFLRKYGLTSAILMHGALNLHNIAACLLFRPPSLYSAPDVSEEKTRGQLADAGQLDSVETGSEGHASAGDPLIQKTNDNGPTIRISHNLRQLNDECSGNYERHNCSLSNRIDRKSSKLSLNDIALHSGNIIDNISCSRSIKYLSLPSLCVSGLSYPLSEQEQCLKSTKCDDVITKTSTFFSKDDNDDVCILTSEPGQISDQRSVCSCSSSATSEVKNLRCFQPVELLLILMAGIGINTQCAAAYMPSLGKEQGVNEDRVAYLMTVIGVCDLCKILFGLLADRNWVRRIHIVFFCQVTIGVTFQFVSFFHGFVPMTIFCVLFGTNTEVMHVLLPGITVDLLGVESIGYVMSGYCLINGLVMSLTHIMVGWLKDETGSFTGGYHLIGGLVLFSVLLILLEPLITLLVPKDQRRTVGTSKACQICFRESEH